MAATLRIERTVRTKSRSFGIIPVGDVFIYDGVPHLKIKPSKGNFPDTSMTMNSLCLISFSLHSFTDNSRVSPVHSTKLEIVE